MIKKQLLLLEYWFSARPSSERRSFFLLVIFGLPALFYLLVWNPLNNQTISLGKKISELDTRYHLWSTQVEALKKISDDPRVLQWKHEQTNLQKNAKNLQEVLTSSNGFLHEELLSLLFQQQNTVQLEKINYEKSNLSVPFQYAIPLEIRLLSLNLSGEYYDFVHYLERLENAWPALKLNSVNYQVTDYPRANIQVNLAVLYAKK